jgi:transposase
MTEKLLPETKAEIYTHSEHGMSQFEISKMYYISQSTVSKTIKKYKHRGDYSRKPGSGRKKVLSSSDLDFCSHEIEREPKIGSRKLKTKLTEERGKSVSDRTIRRNLCSIGLHGRVACKKPLLSKANIEKRYEHSKVWINYENSDWERIIWSDETKINLFGSDGKAYVRRKPGTRYKNQNLTPTVKYGGGSVMVWACFSSKGVGKITIIDGTMNAEGYCRILDTCLLESASELKMTDFIFQQDNDPKHTSVTVKEYLDIKKVKTMSWPPQSPDMNPIENLWRHLKILVSNRNPKNIKDLKEIIVQEWNRIDPKICKKLVSSMHQRALDLWLAKGNHTKY